MLKCKLSCARDCAATASDCNVCSFRRDSAFVSELPRTASKLRRRYSVSYDLWVGGMPYLGYTDFLLEDQIHPRVEPVLYG